MSLWSRTTTMMCERSYFFLTKLVLTISATSSKPFPIDPDDVEETHQLTFRAVFVGCLLGAIVGASNIYLGLKTGFTFGPQLFGVSCALLLQDLLVDCLPKYRLSSVIPF